MYASVDLTFFGDVRCHVAKRWMCKFTGMASLISRSHVVTRHVLMQRVDVGRWVFGAHRCSLRRYVRLNQWTCVTTTADRMWQRHRLRGFVRVRPSSGGRTTSTCIALSRTCSVRERSHVSSQTALVCLLVDAPYRDASWRMEQALNNGVLPGDTGEHPCMLPPFGILGAGSSCLDSLG